MKKQLQRFFSLGLAVCLALALAACGGSGGTRVPVDKNTAVNDYAEILSEDTATYVTNLTVALQQTCGAQIGVYTLEYVGNDTIEGYAYRVFNEWGLGDEDKNNGILLLLAVGEDDYYVMRGAGLESQLTTATLSSTLDTYMEPYWLAGDYDGGTRATVRTLAALLCNIYGLTMDVDAVAAGTATASGVPASEESGGFPFLTVLLIIIAIVLVVWLLGQTSRRKDRRPPNTAPLPPPPGGPLYTNGGYTAPRQRSSFSDGLSSGIGFGIGQNIGRRMFGGGSTRRPPSAPPPSRPPRPPRSGMGGFGGMGGAGRSSGSFHAGGSSRSSGSFRSGGSGRSSGGIRSGGGSFRAGGGMSRGGGAGRRH